MEGPGVPRVRRLAAEDQLRDEAAADLLVEVGVLEEAAARAARLRGQVRCPESRLLSLSLQLADQLVGRVVLPRERLLVRIDVLLHERAHALAPLLHSAMIADMPEAFEAVLGPITEPVLLPGGASKEAWAVDAGGERLLVRRAGGGVIHRHTLSLQHEFEVLEVAYEQGVKAPRPIAYIEDLEGREAFVMERLEGGTIGRRIVRASVPGGLPVQMAEELAKIHALPPARL